MARLAQQNRGSRRGNRVVLYVRVSDIAGREDSLISDEVQIQVCRKYAAREGLRIVVIVKDIDLSGRSIVKRSVRKAIQYVERDEADGVVVMKINRWGRNHMDSMGNIIDLQNAGGFILSATENLEEIHTPMGKFSLTQMLAIAELQSDQIGESWSSVHEFRRNAGLPHGGGDRFGYIYEKSGGRGEAKGRYVIDPETGPWLRKAYEMYNSGLPMTQVLRTLNEAHVLTTRGTLWRYISLRTCLDSGFGAGKIIQKPKSSKTRNISTFVWRPGAQDPVIDEATWQAYLVRRNDKIAPRIKSAPYRCAGLVRCAGCGVAMSVRWSVDTRAGRHRAARRVLNCHKFDYTTYKYSCPKPTVISVDMLDAAVFEWLTQNATDERIAQMELDRARHAQSIRGDVQRVDKDIERLTRRLVSATEKMLDGVLAEDTFRALEASTQAELASLRETRSKLSTEVVVNELPALSALQAIAVGWEALDPAIINQGLRRVIRRIEVSRVQRGDDSDRVRVVGRWEPEESI